MNLVALYPKGFRSIVQLIWLFITINLSNQFFSVVQFTTAVDARTKGLPHIMKTVAQLQTSGPFRTPNKGSIQCYSVGQTKITGEPQIVIYVFVKFGFLYGLSQLNKNHARRFLLIHFIVFLPILTLDLLLSGKGVAFQAETRVSLAFI